MSAVNAWGNEVRPRWRIAIANAIGWMGEKLLNLSWRVVGPAERPIDRFVYRATPGYDTARNGDYHPWKPVVVGGELKWRQG